MIYYLCKELRLLYWNSWKLERNILLLAFLACGSANSVPKLCQSLKTIRQ